MWFDTDGNVNLDTEGRYERGTVVRIDYGYLEGELVEGIFWNEGEEVDQELLAERLAELEELGHDTSGYTINTYTSWSNGVLGVQTEIALPGDYYFWEPADIYSGIHDISTHASDFNLDVDADGIMDYFIS